jgi:asparagine synthase (glutamine-hydrolysing)
VVSENWFNIDDLHGAVAPVEDMLRPWRHLSSLKQMMLLDLQTYLTAQNLVNMDKVSMRHSVEVRVPFLYRPLAQIGLSTPDASLVRWSRGKMPLRNLAKRVLPGALQRNPKMGFGALLGRTLRSPEMKDLLLGDSLRRRGMFNPTQVQSLWRAATATDDASAAGVELYAVAVVEQWFREFMHAAPHRH